MLVPPQISEMAPEQTGAENAENLWENTVAKLNGRMMHRPMLVLIPSPSIRAINGPLRGALSQRSPSGFSQRNRITRIS
jgi:hypothetical protein